MAENGRHDLGTDLFVAARDDRGFDLGQIVGVQVKAGNTEGTGGKYFGEPETDADGTLRGYWFRDPDRSHIDAWLAHGLPHILVLYATDRHAAYWAHVHPEAVVPASKGAKVLIPVDQLLDADHRDALLAVAATQRPRVEWEGTAWSGASSLLPHQALRHALLVPRLVAPHPNVTLDAPLNAVQAVALLTRTQVSELRRRLGLAPTDTDIDAAIDPGSWGWRFAQALLSRVKGGQLTGSSELIDQAPSAAERAAATVVAAAALIEDGDVDEALVVLTADVERDDADPVDHAWLAVQRARCLAELGHLALARDEAVRAQRVRTTHPEDLTASAIGGLAATLVFNLSEWGEGDLASGISGGDTSAVWWRTLATSRGLGAGADRVFARWAHDQTTRIGGGDVANDELLSASLLAGYLGDHPAWTRLTAQLGREHLTRTTRNSALEPARTGLNLLRLAGDIQGVGHATRWLVLNGPAAAVTEALDAIDPAAFTHTTARSSLALWHAGGDVARPETATLATRWLLDTLTDPSTFEARTTPSNYIEPELVRALTALVPAADTAEQRAAAQHLAALGARSDDLEAQAWAGLAQALPAAAWEPDVARRLADTADQHAAPLQAAALAVAAPHSLHVHDRIVALMEQGSFHAKVAFGDVRALPAAIVASEIASLEQRCAGLCESAGRGAYGAGGQDHVHTLTLLNIWHPDQARWQPVYDTLRHPAVAPWDKNAALRLLAQTSTRLPTDVVAALRDVVALVLDTADLPLPPQLRGVERSAHGAALDCSTALSDSDSLFTEHQDQVMQLIAGDEADRRSAAHLARHGREATSIGLLAALTQDPHPLVRATAAASLVYLTTTEPLPTAGAGRGKTSSRTSDDVQARSAETLEETPKFETVSVASLAAAALHRAVQDQGTAVARHVVECYDQRGAVPPRSILNVLHNHASADVRATAAAFDEPLSPSA